MRFYMPFFFFFYAYLDLKSLFISKKRLWMPYFDLKGRIKSVLFCILYAPK